MKRMLVGTIAALSAITISVSVASPASADAADRRLVKAVVMATYYDQDYDSQDTLCWGWLNFPNMAYSELGSAFNGMGISRKDIRAGIRSAFNTVC